MYQDRQFQTHEQARAFYMTVAVTVDMIRNRRRQLGLVDPHITNKDDATSVANIVSTSKREKGEKSPFVYYKAKGEQNTDTRENKGSLFTKEDFLLVIQTPAQAMMMADNPRIIFVDATHGLTAYGYQVMSVVVVDRFGNGLVVAFAITSRENEETWFLFGKSLRQPSLSCCVEVMMSDDTNSAWNGMTRVWRTLKHKLLCHWHLKKNVRERCVGRKAEDSPSVGDSKERKCIKIVPKKTYGMSAWEFFVCLMIETNETEFRRLLTLFKSNLVQHKQRSLLAYLEKYYFTEERLKQWTMWYRQKMYDVEWIANTNMFVEAWHNVLKTHVLGRKKNVRVDTLIRALLKSENRY